MLEKHDKTEKVSNMAEITSSTETPKTTAQPVAQTTPEPITDYRRWREPGYAGPRDISQSGGYWAKREAAGTAYTTGTTKEKLLAKQSLNIQENLDTERAAIQKEALETLEGAGVVENGQIDVQAAVAKGLGSSLIPVGVDVETVRYQTVALATEPYTNKSTGQVDIVSALRDKVPVSYLNTIVGKKAVTKAQGVVDEQLKFESEVLPKTPVEFQEAYKAKDWDKLDRLAEQYQTEYDNWASQFTDKELSEIKSGKYAVPDVSTGQTVQTTKEIYDDWVSQGSPTAVQMLMRGDEFREWINKEAPDRFRIAYKTGGNAALQKEIDNQDTALARLRSAGFVDRAEGQVSGIGSPEKKYKTYTIPDMAEFVRKNPDGEKILNDAGFTEDVISNVKQWNKDTGDVVDYLDKGTQVTGSGITARLGLTGGEIGALSRAMSELGIRSVEGSDVVAYRQLNDDQKRAVAALFSQDYSKGNTFSSFAKTVEELSRENLAQSVLFAPIQAITSPIGKQITLPEARAIMSREYAPVISQLGNYVKSDGSFNIKKLDKDIKANKLPIKDVLQTTGYEDVDSLKNDLEYYNYSTKVSAEEWATGAAVAALDLLMLGGASLIGSGIARTLATKGIQAGALAVFVPQQMRSWDALTIPEKALAVGMDALLFTGAMPKVKLSEVMSLLKRVHKGEGGYVRLPGAPRSVVDLVSKTVKLTEPEAAELETALSRVKAALGERSPYRLVDAAKGLQSVARRINSDMMIRYASDMINDPVGYIEGISKGTKASGNIESATRLQRASDAEIAVEKSTAKTKVLTAEDVGLTEAEFAEFLKERVKNPELTVEAFKASLKGKPSVDWAEETKRMLDDLNKRVKEEAARKKAVVEAERAKELTESQVMLRRIKERIEARIAAEEAERLKREQAMKELDRAKEKYDPEYGRKVGEINKRIREELEQIKERAKEVEQAKEVAETITKTVAKTKSKEDTETATSLAVALSVQLEELQQTETELREELEEQSETLTEVAPQPEVEPAPETLPEEEVEPEEEMATTVTTLLEDTSEEEPPPEETPPPEEEPPPREEPPPEEEPPLEDVPPPPPTYDKIDEATLTPVVPVYGSRAGGVNRVKIAEGSIAYKKGLFWKWIPPEDFRNGVKPRTLPRGVSPIGADLSGGNSPYTTIQRIGKSSVVVPERISIDEGITDAFITDYGRNISYSGKGERTDVGERLSSTTKGMTVGAGSGAKGHAYSRKTVSRRGYFDEDEEWLNSLDPPITRVKRRVVSNKKSVRRQGNIPARMGGVRL